MAEQHQVLGDTLGAGRPDVVTMDLFEKKRAVPAGAGTDTTDHPDDHRQDNELPGMYAGVVTGYRHQVQHLSDQELTTDDVEEP